VVCSQWVCERALSSVKGATAHKPNTNHPPCLRWVFVVGGTLWVCGHPSCPSFLAIGGYIKLGGCTMCNTNQKRFYSPQFSAMASISVRRLAWAMGKSMPATVDIIVKLIPSIVDPSKVCLSCKDSTKCQGCTFRTQLTPQEQGALLAAL
jgi:hypothetical protein